MAIRFLFFYLSIVQSSFVLCKPQRCSCLGLNQSLTVHCSTYDRKEVTECLKSNVDVTYLEISDSGLEKVPKEIKILQHLSTLVLSNNRISMLQAKQFKPVAKTLTRLKMDFNNLSKLKQGCLDNLKELTHLDLSHNKIEKIENGTFTRHLKALVNIQLPFNNLTELDTSLFLLPRSTQLPYSHTTTNTSFNLIRQFTNSIGATINDISPNMSIMIVMENNNFTTVDYKLYGKMFNVSSIVQIFNTANCGLDMRFNPFVCDCRMYVVSVFLAYYRKMSNDSNNPIFDLTCNTPPQLNGKYIYTVPPNDFNCTVKKDCPNGCSCMYTKALDLMTITCMEDRFTALPHVLPRAKEIHLHVHSRQLRKISNRSYLINVTSLDLSSSAISAIETSALSSFDLIKTISLRDNAITRLPRAIEQLTFTKLRHLDLTGNPFICDCHSLWFKRWLKRRIGFIDAVEAIRCSLGDGKGNSVVDVPDSQFTCPLSNEMIIVICASSAFLLFVILMIIYGKKTEIHVLLIHYFNCNLFRRRVKTDANFDLFVSHSSKDAEYVLETFIPRLKGNRPPFRVCTYEEHFRIGRTIVENINRCISESIATVLLVSNDFLRSEWCTHEFQEAHKQLLRSKDAILIVIVLEDLEADLIDEELKTYLRTHVYLDINDTFFWSKLIRSLPVREAVGASASQCDESTPLIKGHP